MTVPAYYRSRQGRVFRVQRARTELPDGVARYLLRATPIRATDGNGVAAPVEVMLEMNVEDLRDRIQRRHQVPTPEQTFEQLWQRLRVDLEAA